MIMVEILENKRYFEGEDSDFYISFKDGPKELPQKALKGMSVKRELFNGTLKVVGGEFVVHIKHAKVYFYGIFQNLDSGLTLIARFHPRGTSLASAVPGGRGVVGGPQK